MPELFTDSDLRVAVTALIGAVGEHDSDEEADLIDSTLAAAAAARLNRIREPLMPIESPDQALTEKVACARERKLMTQRDKRIKSREAELDKRIKEFAEQAVIMPPYKVDGATVYFATDVKPGVVYEGEEATDEEREAFYRTLRGNPEWEDFITRGYNYKGMQSHFKREHDEGRIEPDGNGVYVEGGLRVEFGTKVQVRGA